MQARQELVSSENPDLFELNEIDLQLIELGVEFLDAEEVQEQFPEAYQAVFPTITTEDMQFSADGVAQPCFDIENVESDNILWTSYRAEDYWCDDDWLNIQRVMATPLNENSSLWIEGNSTDNYSSNSPFISVMSNLFDIAALTTIGQISQKVATVMEIIAAVENGLRNASHVRIDSTIQRWEVQATVVFSFVRYESQTDLDQHLCVIANRCITKLGIILDVDEYTLTENGVAIPAPSLVATTIDFIHQSQHYNSNARAGYVFLHPNANPWPVNDCITRLNIARPNSNQVDSIFLPIISHPYDCNY